MKYIITASTDHKYLGHVVETDLNSIIFEDGIAIIFDTTLPLPDGVRLISSNYIIDAREV